MRHRCMGSGPGSPGMFYAGTEPPYALFPTWGAQASLSATDREYPILVSPQDCVAALGKVRMYKVEYDYSVYVDALADTTDATLTSYFRSVIDYEYELFTYQAEESAPFGTPSGTPNTSGFVNGTPIDIPPIPAVMRLLPNAASTSVRNTVGPNVPHYYDPSTGMFLPRIVWHLTGVPGNYVITNEDLDPADYGGAGQDQAATATASFLGQTSYCYMIIGEDDVLNSFTCTITAIEYWEHRDSAGANPMWNSSTGAAIISHESEAD